MSQLGPTLFENVRNLDLNYIVKHLVHRESFTLEAAEDSVRRYKNFLILHIKYPMNRGSPTKEIDAAWHVHILHTEKYIKDCEMLFGEYYHHCPASSGKESLEEMLQYFLNTKQLYEKEFLEPYSSFPEVSTFW